MTGSKFYQFLFIIWIGMNLSSAQASQTPADTKPYSLGEVVVSAEMPGKETIPTIEVTDVEIKNRNAKTLDKALELVPGLNVSVRAKGTPRIDMRGFRSRHVILLLNGIPINSTYDGQFDPHLISTENISKIKVSYGNNSVLYGQGGLAGAINIITKQGTQGLHTDASAQINERGNHYTQANISGGKEKVNFFLSVNNTDSDGFSLSDSFTDAEYEDGGLRENSDDERLSFFGNIGFEVNEKFELGLTLEKSSGEFGIPPVTQYINNNDDSYYKKIKYDRTEDFDTLSGQISMSYDPDGIMGFRAWAFANEYEEDTARYDDDTYSAITKSGSYTQNSKTSIQGVTLQTSFDFEASGEAVFSFSGEKDEYTSDLDEIDKKLNIVSSHENHDLDIYSAAFEYKRQLFSSLDFVLGYSHHWLSKESGNDDDKGSYMIATAYNLTDETILRASYARKIRFPSIKQLYGSDGNEDLTTEQSDNYEVGITQQLPWEMQLDLAVYQNNVEDFIEEDSSGNTSNYDEYQFRGMDFRLSKHFLETGSMALGYSLLDSEDQSKDSLRDELQNRPEHKFTIELNYTWDFGLSAHADFIHIANQYYYNNDETVQSELDDYTVVNLKLEQKLFKENYFVYVGVDNLFDDDYEETIGYPREGRTAYAGVRVKF
ncbi:TonB-dependent receptor plug domain-containing protein [Desulfobacula toluolica]|uniref:FecA: TonB-dependent receptor associated with ABC-type iron(III) transporter n=1 Tax=Desulfobacula toluolica (strain DSM 7467 / Tol2) TaxID=651182 RepID=K0NGZ5_DESTT|nr:TonB-dependent receptor [Desulfobacula toluolica]CCK79118.1 FecA: TonB-dependent receptor associated with ABC-type iron(III) transporter [Desulfobacula toluolica Tol2]